MKRIDEIVLWLIVLAVLTLCFLAATGDNLPLTAILSASVCLFLRALARRLAARVCGRSRRERRRYARYLLEQWQYLPEEETAGKLRALIARRLPGFSSDAHMICLPLSVNSKAFDADHVIAQWRQYRGADEIILASLSPASETTRAFASRLSQPTVRLADSDILENLLLREYPVVPETFRPAKPRRPSPALLWRRLLESIQPVKTALYALGSLAFYLMGGRLIHLAAFGLFLTLTLLGLHRRFAY